MPMTPLQADCLAYIQFLFAGELKGLAVLYKPSGVMAHIQIESAFRVDVGDDTGDGAASAGLMQVIPATAAAMGVRGSMLNPANSILAGMRYLDNCRVLLGHYFAKQNRTLLVTDVVASYNEGPGNVMRGRQDPGYVTKWEEAQAQWAHVDAMPMDPKAAHALAQMKAGTQEDPGETAVSPAEAPPVATVEATAPAAGGAPAVEAAPQSATSPPAVTPSPAKAPKQKPTQGDAAGDDQSEQPPEAGDQSEADAEALNAQELKDLANPTVAAARAAGGAA